MLGPDGHHDACPWAPGPGLDDNAYTNARDLLRRLGHPARHELLRHTAGCHLRRTVHGSTLSPVAHSWVLTRFGQLRSRASRASRTRDQVCSVVRGVCWKLPARSRAT